MFGVLSQIPDHCAFMRLLDLANTIDVKNDFTTEEGE
jgi:hypothetical protein